MYANSCIAFQEAVVTPSLAKRVTVVVAAGTVAIAINVERAVTCRGNVPRVAAVAREVSAAARLFSECYLLLKYLCNSEANMFNSHCYVFELLWL